MLRIQSKKKKKPGKVTEKMRKLMILNYRCFFCTNKNYCFGNDVVEHKNRLHLKLHHLLLVQNE